MQVRPIRPDELERFAFIEQAAFLFDRTSIPTWIEHTLKPSMADIRVLEQDGNIVSVLRVIYPELWLGAGRVKMPGITNVATPPQYRRYGYLKVLLTDVLNELYHAGHAISTLYPFDFPFYKKFGYELVSTQKDVKLKMGALQSLRSKATGKGRWIAASLEQWADLNAIYQAQANGNFGRLTRDQYWWQKRIMCNMKEEPHPAYIWQDATGRNRAYIVYSFKKLDGEWDRELRVHDQGWLDSAAQLELLAFLANHDAQAGAVTWTAASDQELFALLSDPREAEEKIYPGYMLRILDAVRALTERPWYSNANGNFALALQDDRLEWNNNITLHIAVENGQAQVKSVPGTDKAGLSCDIRQLSQMYAGYLSPHQLADLGLLEVRDVAQLDAAQQAFFAHGQPASFMADHF